MAACAALAVAVLVGEGTTVGVRGFLGGEGSVATATKTLYRAFGEEPLVVIVKGPLQRLVVGENILHLSELERCLAGELPAGGYPCNALAKGRFFRSLLGPGEIARATAQRLEGTLGALLAKARRAALAAGEAVRRQAIARGEREAAPTLAKEAEAATLAAYAKEGELLARRFGLYGPPEPANPAFVLPLFFKDGGASPQPKQRYATLLPTPNLALIALRPRAGLSEGARSQAVHLVAAALKDPAFALVGGRYGLSGEPAVVAEVGEEVGGELIRLLVGAVAVAAFVLALLFRGRPRLQALFVAGAAALVAVGIFALASGGLSLAALAVAPALIGLGVDYALQAQAAVEREGRRVAARSAGVAMAGSFGRLLGTAAAASGAALVVLLASPLGVVRSLSLYLIVGLAVAFLLAVAVASAVPALPGRRLGFGAFARAWRSAQDLLRSAVRRSGVAAVGIRLGLSRPSAVVAVAGALACAGFALAGSEETQTELSQLLPHRLGAVSSLASVQREAGFGGQLNLLVSGANLAQPGVLGWLAAYQRRVVGAVGGASCKTAPLCPTLSLAGLPSRAQPRRLRALFYAIPPQLRDQLITPNHRLILLSFAQRLLSASAEQRLIDRVLALADPPPGVTVRPAGLLAAVGQEGAALSSPSRRLVSGLLSLLAGAVVVAALSRSLRLAAVCAVFSAIVLGWSILLLVGLGVALNPLSSSLSAVVVAVAYEFAVLLAGRYALLLRSGAPPAALLNRLYATTGATVFTSGAAVIAAFGVLALAPIPLLSQFGAGTVAELACLELAVFLALPALLTMLLGARFAQPAVAAGWRSKAPVGGR